MNGIKLIVEGVRVDSFVSSKTEQEYFTFEVTEPVKKFIGFTNNAEKGQLQDISKKGEFVDLTLVLKNDRLYFVSAETSS